MAKRIAGARPPAALPRRGSRRYSALRVGEGERKRSIIRGHPPFHYEAGSAKNVLQNRAVVFVTELGSNALPRSEGDDTDFGNRDLLGLPCSEVHLDAM